MLIDPYVWTPKGLHGITDHIHKWDGRYLRLARFWAEECSKDPTTKVGAVIVSGTRPRRIAIGYNGFPPNVRDLPERLDDRQVKYKFTQHAERNVLDNADFDVNGATLYCTMFPCVECAKSIISKGISRVVTLVPPAPIDEPSWRDDIPVGITMMEEDGVTIHCYVGIPRGGSEPPVPAPPG